MGVYACKRKRLKVTQQRGEPNVKPPTVLRPTLKSPRYVSGITLFGTAGVVTPRSPSGFGYWGGERSPWVQLQRPASLSVAEPSPRGVYHGQLPSNIITHSTEPHDFDVDLIPDMATISSSHSSIDNHSNAPATPSLAHTHSHSYSQSPRATPDVPVAAERLSMFYPSSAGSEYIHSESSSRAVSIAESVEPFTAGVREMDISSESESRYWMGQRLMNA
jgi:hypothetical protein